MSSNNDINKPNFDRYIEELYKINTYDKNRADLIAQRGLEELGITDIDNKSTIFLGIEKGKAILVGICILFILCGFLSSRIELIFIYFFGLVFFFAGLFIGLNVPVFGLIFLCTHGGAGLFILLSSFFGGFDDYNKILNNPVFTDGGIPKDLKTYLTAIVTIFVIALIYTLLHNLSPKLKENKIHMILILLLFLIGIILVGLIPRIFPYIMNF